MTLFAAGQMAVLLQAAKETRRFWKTGGKRVENGSMLVYVTDPCCIGSVCASLWRPSAATARRRLTPDSDSEFPEPMTGGNRDGVVPRVPRTAIVPVKHQIRLTSTKALFRLS